MMAQPPSPGSRESEQQAPVTSAARDSMMPRPAQVNDVDWHGIGVPVKRPFTLALQVGSEHISPIIPHVPNTMYLEWCEAMAIAHSASLGFTHRWHRDHDFIWFVRRHEIDYLAESRHADELVMATWVERMEKSRSERHYLIYRPRDQAIVVRGLTTWVLVSIQSRRPRRIPDEMMRRYLTSTE